MSEQAQHIIDGLKILIKGLTSIVENGDSTAATIAQQTLDAYVEATCDI